MRNAVKPWLGGYVRITDGRPVYVIRKRIDGRQFEISTRCNTERAALKQLEKFEADPGNYAPGELVAKKEGTFLDEALAVRFLVHCRDVKKNSPEWLYQQKRYVAWWAKQLQGIDLRKVTLQGHIHPALEGQTARPHRIATIKAVYAWLRKVTNEIVPSEDPTLDALMVPQAQPGARSLKNKVIDADHHKRARAVMAGHWAAAIDVQAGTGWHITEVRRFAQAGAIEEHPNGKVQGIAGVLVCPEAKGGGELRTSVSPKVLEAGKLLLARGSFSIGKYRLAVKEACEIVNVRALAEAQKTGAKPDLIEIFTPGRYRHTVGSMAVNSGDAPAQVSAFLNHKDPRTLKRFYATHAVVPKVTTLL